MSVNKPPFSGSTYADLSYNIINSEPDLLPAELDENFKKLIEKSLYKSSKERPTAIELCLLFPAPIIHNYISPNKPTLASLTFMNPTQSTIGRQKSISKRMDIDNLKISKSRKDKFKTPKRESNQDLHQDAYVTHHSSFIKPAHVTEEKKTFARLGELRMRKDPYNHFTSERPRKFSLKYVSSNESPKKPPRPPSK